MDGRTCIHVLNLRADHEWPLAHHKRDGLVREFRRAAGGEMTEEDVALLAALKQHGVRCERYMTSPPRGMALSSQDFTGSLADFVRLLASLLEGK